MATDQILLIGNIGWGLRGGNDYSVDLQAQQSHHYMSLFGNQNFINQVAKEVGLPNLPEDVAALLQTLVEIETRKFIQQGAKFARSDARDELSFEDLESALIDMRHSEIVLVEQEEDYVRDGSFIVRRDPVYSSARNFIQEELKVLSLNSFSTPKLRGRWVYLDGRIPRTNENALLKCKSEIISIRLREKGEKNKQFNIIMDQPEAMLTGFELEYFKEVTALLSEGNDSIGKLAGVDITGNLSNLLPLFLKYFLSSTMTDMKMSFLLSMLSNSYIQKSAEFYLHQILTCLWAYEGKLCLQVGLRIGRYLQKFQQKYKVLRQNWTEEDPHEMAASEEVRNTAYSNMIKKIGIELITGNSFAFDQRLADLLNADAAKNNEMAAFCLEIIQEYSPVISCLQEKALAFWLPSESQKDNCYMMMNL